MLNQKEVKHLEKREDEWRRKLQKLEADWTKKLEKKEEEWKKQMEEKQSDWRRSIELLEKEKGALEEEKREIVQQKLNLEEALKVADGMLCCFLKNLVVCLNRISTINA